MGTVDSSRLAPRVEPDALLELLSDGHPPAFATDSRDRIVFWNAGMAELFGRRSDDVLGRHCYETLCGRDVFGNRYCFASCPVIAALREGDPVRRFELCVPAVGTGPRRVSVTILKIPGVRPDLFTVVHILEPIAEEARGARSLAGPNDRTSGPTHSLGIPPAAAPPSLTRREAEILRHVATGLQNKEVAQKLGLSLATVRNHVHNILDKLGVHSKLEAVSVAFRKGWVSSDGDIGRSAMTGIADQLL